MDKKIDRKAMDVGSIFRSLIRGQVEGDVSCSNHKFPSPLEGRSLEKQVDASPEGMSNSNEFVRDHSSLLSLQPWIFRKEICQDDEDKMNVNGGFSDRLSRLADASQPGLSPPKNINLGFGRGRDRRSLRSRRSHRYSVKPVTSVGNCLIPQLYSEHFELDEYVLSSVQSSILPTVRPLIITDGNRVISRSTCDTLGMSSESELLQEVDGMSSREMESVIGVPPLPQIWSPKQKSRESLHRNLETSNSSRTCKVSNSPDTPCRILLFCLGINIGLISTIISTRREIERLNNTLEHTENLVQDLQEELEMKDSLTVKELDNEAEGRTLDDSYPNIHDSIDLLQTQVPASFPTKNTDVKDQTHSKTAEISELSRIEAELEAELERLELNMNASSLDGRMSALGEQDPDLIADLVHGELRADVLNGRAPGGQAEADRESHSTSTTETHNVNYAVSPRELSLRLHEVIQFRLEERVKELESALCHSQKQLEFMKAERVLSQSKRAFSNSEMGSYSDTESPSLSGQDGPLAQPLCLNLSGDAMAAYDEAYEEFMQIGDNQEEDLPLPANTSKGLNVDGLLRSDWSPIQDSECIARRELSVDTRPFRTVSRDSTDTCESNDTDDDEEGKILIQQIVERTRQGSPAAVLHAQRMLFAIDEY